MKPPKAVVMPIPVDEDIDTAVREGAERVGLKLADVMRQGLRHGVPAFLQRLRTVTAERPPRCLDYLDEYPRSRATAKGYKTELHRTLTKKHAGAHRRRRVHHRAQ